MEWTEVKADLEALLPKVAAATTDVGGVLVGGTALALQLQHRASFDIDILAARDFRAQAVLSRLESQSDTFVTEQVGINSVAATLNGIRVEVWKPRDRQTPVEDGPVIMGMQLASLPDLFALKLRAVRNRAQLRDYFDIATLIDRAMSLQDGLRAYAARYHLYLVYEDLYDVLSVLTPPPRDLPADAPFDRHREKVLRSVHLAAENAIGWLTQRSKVAGAEEKSPDSPRFPRV